MYKRFYKTCRKYRFNRILIDEADTIKLSKDIECQFNFMWFITGTSSGLFSGSKIFLNKIFKNNDLNILKYFVFKNDNSYIDQSIKLPPPKIFKIKCLSPKELNIIKNLIPQSVLQMINAGNTEQAIKALNCNVDTNENIFQVITKNLVDSISNKEIELEAETKKHYPINLKKEHDQKIKFIENQLEKLKDKYKDIKKRIYELNDTNCPVCMSEFSNPVMVSCCNNTFCFDCLALSIGELKNNKCPYCRQQICKKQIHIFESDTIKKSEDSLNLSKNNHDIKDKLDVLLDIVQKKQDASIMIFAGFIETFNKIESKLKELSISYHILKGHTSIVSKYIDDFKEKKVRILMLNAQFFGAGMNLQMATDIIIYHRFSSEMEEQIIGRAQRLGRSINEPLNVYFLLHDNESNNIQNEFKFEDYSNINYLDWLEQNKNNNLNDKINFNNNNEIINNLNNNEIINNLNDNEIINDLDEDIINKFIIENDLDEDLDFDKFEIIN